MANVMTPLLDARDLRIRFGASEAVRGISFHLAEGDVLGLVGESGSGKSSRWQRWHKETKTSILRRFSTLSRALLVRAWRSYAIESNYVTDPICETRGAEDVTRSSHIFAPNAT